jgi:hypothetical protein
MPRTTIKSEDIADTTVVAADLRDDSITNAKIKSDAAIEASKLESTLDLSGKTVTLAAGEVSATELDATLDLSGKTVTLPAASVTSHVTAYDDAGVRNDISTLALHSAIADNKAAYNLSNAFIDQFEDSTGIDTTTDTERNTAEWVGRIVGYGGLDSSTKLLLHMDGADDGTVFTDSSTSPHTMSRNGTVTKTGTKKFGTASAYFGGYGTNQYLTAPDSEDWNFGAGDFTLDFWINMPDVTHGGDDGLSAIMGPSYNAYNWHAVCWVAPSNSTFSTGIMFYAKNGSQGELFRFEQGSTSGYVNNTWYHIAVTRNGSTWKLWRDGTTIATRSGSETLVNWTYPWVIGALGIAGYREYKGYIDEVRISKGIDRTGQVGDPMYTTGATFTPPTQAYESSAVNATGNFTSATQTASASVSEMGIVVLYKNNEGTASLNTDLVAQVSANGGTNYSNATLVAGGTFSSGINIAAVSGVSVTAGTAPKYKISFANQVKDSKETEVHGVALLY